MARSTSISTTAALSLCRLRSYSPSRTSRGGPLKKYANMQSVLLLFRNLVEHIHLHQSSGQNAMRCCENVSIANQGTAASKIKFAKTRTIADQCHVREFFFIGNDSANHKRHIRRPTPQNFLFKRFRIESGGYKRFLIGSFLILFAF